MPMQALEIQILLLVPIIPANSNNRTHQRNTIRIKTTINDSKTTSQAALRIEIPQPLQATETTINKHHSSNRISRMLVNLVDTNPKTTTAVGTEDPRMPRMVAIQMKVLHVADRIPSITNLIPHTIPTRNSPSTGTITITITILALVDGVLNTIRPQIPAERVNKLTPTTTVIHPKGTQRKVIPGNTRMGHLINTNNNSSSNHLSILATNRCKDTMLAVLLVLVPTLSNKKDLDTARRSPRNSLALRRIPTQLKEGIHRHIKRRVNQRKDPVVLRHLNHRSNSPARRQPETTTAK